MSAREQEPRQEITGLEALIAKYPPRALAEGDLDALMELEDANFGPNSGRGDKAGRRYWQREIWHDPYKTDIIEAEGKVVGCVNVNLRNSQKEPGRYYGEISSIAVASEYRGQGVGQFLLQRGMDKLFEIDITGVLLYTHVNNEPMQKLAEKNGFKKEVTLENYYRQGTGNRDAYIYVYRKPNN